MAQAEIETFDADTANERTPPTANLLIARHKKDERSLYHPGWQTVFRLVEKDIQMKRRAHDAIDFPANPFVAFADFLIVLVLVLIIALVQQSLSNSSLMERAAVANTQQELNANIKQAQGQDQEIRTASQATEKEQDLAEVAVDGDLQRFRLRGALSFAPHSTTLTPRGKTLLVAFGNQLADLQGNPFDNATHPFKRIIVNGHADMSEGNEAQVWQLSLQRAQAAITVLREQCGIHPTLLEAAGRGAFEPAMNRGQASETRVAEANRRLEVVVVYSGNISLLYLQGLQDKHRPR